MSGGAGGAAGALATRQGRLLAQESSDDESGDIIMQDTAGAAVSPVLHLLMLSPDAGQVVLDTRNPRLQSADYRIYTH